MSDLVVTRCDLGQAVELIRSSVVYVDRKGTRVEEPSPKCKTLRGTWADSILKTLVITFDWTIAKAQAVLATLKKRSNPRLRDTHDGRIVSVCPPSQRHRSQAVRQGRRQRTMLVQERPDDVQTPTRVWPELMAVDEKIRRNQWSDYFSMTEQQLAEERAIAAMEVEQGSLVSFFERVVVSDEPPSSDGRLLEAQLSDGYGDWPPVASDRDVDQLLETGYLIVSRP